jgi:hypothetical protein
VVEAAFDLPGKGHDHDQKNSGALDIFHGKSVSGFGRRTKRANGEKEKISGPA